MHPSARPVARAIGSTKATTAVQTVKQHLPFYAGAMHYWRVDPRRWAPCLARSTRSG